MFMYSKFAHLCVEPYHNISQSSFTSLVCTCEQNHQTPQDTTVTVICGVKGGVRCVLVYVQAGAHPFCVEAVMDPLQTCMVHGAMQCTLSVAWIFLISNYFVWFCGVCVCVISL